MIKSKGRSIDWCWGHRKVLLVVARLATMWARRLHPMVVVVVVVEVVRVEVVVVVVVLVVVLATAQL
jgi:hypothetical protein